MLFALLPLGVGGALLSIATLSFKRFLNARVPAPRFVLHLILRSYNYNRHVGGLLPANLCL